MTPLRIVVLESTTLVEELGLWCGVCCLPTRYHAIYACVVDGEPSGVAELAGCLECGPD